MDAVDVLMGLILVLAAVGIVGMLWLVPFFGALAVGLVLGLGVAIFTED